MTKIYQLTFWPPCIFRFGNTVDVNLSSLDFLCGQILSLNVSAWSGDCISLHINLIDIAIAVFIWIWCPFWCQVNSAAILMLLLLLPFLFYQPICPDLSRLGWHYQKFTFGNCWSWTVYRWDMPFLLLNQQRQSTVKDCCYRTAVNKNFFRHWFQLKDRCRGW